MPAKPRQELKPSLALVLRSYLAQLASGHDPQDIAADVIKKGAERLILQAQLPAGDPQPSAA